MLVTCYFKLDHNKKRSLPEYEDWIARFLANTPALIVFFTTQDLVPWLRSLRPEKYPITFVLYESVYEIESIAKYGMEFWTKQYDMNPEKHAPAEVFAIWNNVPAFVKRAADTIGPSQDEPFIWVYAGCVRNDWWYPYLQNFGAKFNKIPKDKLLLQLLNPIPAHSEIYKAPFGECYVAGGISAGYIDTWRKCSDHYDEMISKYVENGSYVSQDQFIWKSCIQKWPADFQAVLPVPSADPWFFFFVYLST